ncbi:uncharacterized protein LOC141629981 [Silene latifolia]|uniref:uncharacterized protein LOC141629981 n=1 Tax=Silene latifolia TaxID=37657 RepID=UPI003D77A829
MKIASWNVRGCNDSSGKKKSGTSLELIIWISLELLRKELRNRLLLKLLYVYCQITYLANGISYYLTVVYGHKRGEQRKDLWDFLKTVGVNLLHAGLDDVQGTGVEFTRTSKQDPSSRAWSKLDRALVNPEWYQANSHTTLEFLPPSIYDHSPVVITAFKAVNIVRRFSFLNCWVSHPEYDTTVKQAWETHIQGNPIYRLFYKLKLVKAGLISLHKPSYSNIQKRVQLFWQDLTAERSSVQQKAKIENIKHNGCSSSYFYAKLASRKNQQLVGFINDQYDQTQQGLDNVTNAFVDYYTSLLGTATPAEQMDASFLSKGETLNAEDWFTLLAPVNKQEIKDALFSIDPNKSPDPDGFSSGFFKHS